MASRMSSDRKARKSPFPFTADTKSKTSTSSKREATAGKMQKPKKIFGVIEGFYGRPWKIGQRKLLFSFLRDWIGHKAFPMHYIYAPKDDWKLRAHWRDLYTEEELRRFSDTFKDLSSQIRLAFALSPVVDISYTSDKDWTFLVKKIGQIVNVIGAKEIVLLFDDVPEKFTSANDEAVYGNDFGKAQAELVSRLHLYIQQQEWGSGVSLFFCPTVYCDRLVSEGALEKSEYLKSVGEYLHSEVDVFWTGTDIISETVSTESLRGINRLLKRPVILWDNLHANDYDRRRLYLGPYRGRESLALERVKGIVINPNCEFEANYVPMHTFCQYISSPSSYNAPAAHQIALSAWTSYLDVPRSSSSSLSLSLSDVLRIISDFHYLPHKFGETAAEYLHLLRTLTSNLSHHVSGVTDSSATQLPVNVLTESYKSWKTMAQRVITAFEQLCENGSETMYVLYGYMWDIKEELQLHLHAVECMYECSKGDKGIRAGGERERERDYVDTVAENVESVVGISYGNGEASNAQPLVEGGRVNRNWNQMSLRKYYAPKTFRGDFLEECRRILDFDSRTGTAIPSVHMHIAEHRFVTPQVQISERYTARMCREGDLPSLSHICLSTGDGRGGDGASLFPHLSLSLGQRWCWPYVAIEPSLSYVLVDEFHGGKVVGYVLATTASSTFYDQLVRYYLPERIAPHIPIDSESQTWKGLTEEERELCTNIHRPEIKLPKHFMESYPGHLHIDLLPCAQRQGNGRALIELICQELQRRHVRGVHLEMSAENMNALHFYQKLGFRELYRENDRDLFLGKRLM